MDESDTDTGNYRISVKAEAFYIPDQSDESQNRYVFVYKIRITNQGRVGA